MRVSFQGERGAYSDEAIIQHFGEDAEPVPRPYLRDAFRAVEEGEADLGLVPVENSIEGSIVRTYDLLMEGNLRVRGETVLRVVHCLIANPGVKLEDIKKAYSHPQALGQSRDFLEKHGIEAVAAYDTAGSVKMIKEEGLLDAAAVASSRAAEVYDMPILARSIETNPENYTRFLIIGGEDHPPTGRDKTTIGFTVVHKPGTLVKALGAFAERSINLTKIESRPFIGRPWEYIFYVDIEAHRQDQVMVEALEVVEENSNYYKILGSYPRT